MAGVFLFWPLLVQLRFDELVRQAGYAGSQMVPAASALLSLLALKLLDKERRSHISDFNFDRALGLFAGLNILPKTTFATDYSYRTVREQQRRLLSGWVSRLLPLLDPEPGTFSLDFHSIPHRGEPQMLENHYVPMRGKAAPSILTFFAQATKSRLLCYADADLLRQQQPGQLMRFVEFCQEILGQDPAWVYFDSKFTTYAEMNRLNGRGNTSFITIRRRGSRILRGLEEQPASAWRRAVIDTPKRRHRRIRCLAHQLSGFAAVKPKHLYRKFVETGGTVRITEDHIHVHFDKRSHNPILRQAALNTQATSIPWAGGKPLHFTYAGTDS